MAMAMNQKFNEKFQIRPRFGEPTSQNGFFLLTALYLALISSSVLSLTGPATATWTRTTPPPLPVLPIPTAHQLSWQQAEMAMFFHFGTNTFTDSEWGTGHAPPSVFNPTRLNATQWVQVAKDSGFSRVILTAKHHDGFCLWPSEYTNYSVRSSPWRNGAGDVVSELAKAAGEAGVGLGLYLSPWDRHEEIYGRTVPYNEFYLGQMRELLTRYGEIKEVFLDGAKGEGEKDMEYFFETWFSLIHQLQPGSVIFSDAGPDTRWIGDEDGIAGTTCWSLYNASDVPIGGYADPKYKQQGDPAGRDWVPAECDVSIRQGWFWHPTELPKSPLTLLNLYFKSVGRNCLFLLNVPPNKSGLISDEDVRVLRDFHRLRRSIFSNNLAKGALLNASSTRGGSDSPFGPKNALQEGIYSYWAPEQNQSSWVLNLEFQESVSFNVLQLQEPIHMGQRVIKFHLDALNGEGEWRRVVNGTTIGYKRLLQFPTLTGRFFRVVIAKARADPLISHLGIYVNNYIIPGEFDSDRGFRRHNNGSQILQQVTRNSSRSSTVYYV